MLDQNILKQVREIFASLKSKITFKATVDTNDEKKQELKTFLNDFASTSDQLSVEYTEQAGANLHFTLYKGDIATGISFR